MVFISKINKQNKRFELKQFKLCKLTLYSDLEYKLALQTAVRHKSHLSFPEKQMDYILYKLKALETKALLINIF